MKFSNIIGGLLLMVAGSAVATFGFSDSCSNEIMAKATPLLGLLPGMVWAWIARVRMGGVNVAGFRKDATS